MICLIFAAVIVITAAIRVVLILRRVIIGDISNNGIINSNIVRHQLPLFLLCTFLSKMLFLSLSF